MRLDVISQLNLNVVDIHCRISIGEDGPSQMALQDIAMFRSLPCCTLSCPSDAVACAVNKVRRSKYLLRRFLFSVYQLLRGGEPCEGRAVMETDRNGSGLPPNTRSEIKQEAVDTIMRGD